MQKIVSDGKHIELLNKLEKMKKETKKAFTTNESKELEDKFNNLSELISKIEDFINENTTC